MLDTDIEEVSDLKPFTLDDAEEEKACILCEHRPSCAIIAYVNKLSLKRDGRLADTDFNCSIFKEDIEDTVTI